MNFNKVRHNNNNNNKCSCFVKKIDKSVQTGEFVDNNDEGTSCSSSLSSDEAKNVPKQRILPRSICRNRTHVVIDDDDDVNNADSIAYQEIELKQPVVVAPTNGQSRTVFIPAGCPLTQLNFNQRSENGRKNNVKTASTNNPTKDTNHKLENGYKDNVKTCPNDNQTKHTNHRQINETIPTEDGCNCPNFCNKWYNCENWKRFNINFDDNANNTNATKKPLLKQTNITTNIADINKVIDDNLLIHGQHIPKPSDSDVIDEDIRTVVNNCKIDANTKYSWTIIARHLNLFLIGQKQVGKYLNHLPSICTFCLESAFYQDLSQYPGPIIIIVTPYQETSKQIYEQIECLLKESWSSPQIQVVTDRTKEIKRCDLLIIDSWKLLEFLQQSKLPLKRCCHLILESLDILICSRADLLANFLKILNEMLLKRPVMKTFQLIATSDMWMQNFDLFLKHLNSLPVVIFNDCLLDIAVYSNIEIIRKILQDNHTKFYLSDTVRHYYQTKRVLIVCKDQNEICDIGQYLENLRISNFKILENLSDDEVHDYESKFQKLTPGCYKVLICSDSSYKKLENIRNIDWLINYGFSQNWDDFIDRLKCMLEKFASPLQGVPEIDKCRCYFIINEGDEIAQAMYNNFMGMYSKRVVDKLKF